MSRGRAPAAVSPARALAYATIRTTFEDGAHTERAFRQAADEQGLEGRERAQAQRLAYGAVQRRGTADAAIERLAERSPSLLDPPVLGALRLGLYELLFADATAPAMPAGFDRVLVDPPCSDLGALASRPDARWRKSPKAIERLAGLQAEILAAGLGLLRPGGTLVYSTCTISRREGEEQVVALERRAAAGEVAGFAVDDLGALAPGFASPQDPRCLQFRPDRDRTTGFFVCRLRKDD